MNEVDFIKSIDKEFVTELLLSFTLIIPDLNVRLGTPEYHEKKCPSPDQNCSQTDRGSRRFDAAVAVHTTAVAAVNLKHY